MPIKTPGSSRPGKPSSISLITDILNAEINDNPGTLALYLHLWCTNHPSLGDRFMVPGGDVGALSRALNCIYKEHGLLIPSIECRDVDGRVWIGFRREANAKSRRYAMIRTSAYKGTFVSVGWKEGLERLKEEAAVTIAADDVLKNIDVTPYNLRVPNNNTSGAHSPRVRILSSGEAAARLATAGVPTAITNQTPTSWTTGQPSSQHHESEEVVSTVEDGARAQITMVAELPTNTGQRNPKSLVGGEWILVDVKVNQEDEWTEI